MARLSAATALLLLLSLLAVAHCRVLDLEAEPAHDAVSVADEQGPPNPTVPEEASATEVVPAHRIAAGEGFLRLPSHRGHRHPCRHGHALLHRIPWWARHHGIFLQDTYRLHRHGSGFPHLVDSRAHLAVDMPAELPHVDEPKYAEEEVKAFDTDREQEIEEETKKPFHGVEEDDETVRAWKREMRRRFRHGLRFHHRRHHHEDEEEGDHEQDEEGAGAMKRFHHDQDEEEEKTRKRFHHHDDDGDNEDDEAEEMARRWRKAIMRRRFHHGGRFHHHRRHRHHQHAGEADEQQDEEGGVMKWFKDFMNRF